MNCVTVDIVLSPNTPVVTVPFFALTEAAAQILADAFRIAWRNSNGSNGFPGVRNVSQPFRIAGAFTL